MSETQLLLKPNEIIRTTLDLYAKDRRYILMGTSAIHWCIAHRGGNTESIELKDVDILASDTEIFTMKNAINPLYASLSNR